MSFSSLSFLYFFLPAVTILYFVSPSGKLKNMVLLLASLLFYSWGDPRSLFLLLIASALSFAFGLALERHREGAGKKKLLLVLSVSALLGLLVYFKYLNFFVESFAAIIGREFHGLELVIPAGISFFVFQLLSYLFDVYRGQGECEKNFFTFLLYVSFFPQLIQGPIIRYGSIREQLVSRRETLDGAVSGAKRFIVGLGKKVLIADNIAVLAATIYRVPELSGTLALWLAGIIYSLQLYFDFSGYCDMAIGLGHVFGFSLPENFNYPYAAQSVSDFWRRWHISLSTWFRDYIYIPLGGNRVKKGRLIVNIFCVWGLTGLWHGASWNFVFWGLYYGVLLLAEKLLIGDKIKFIPMIIRRVVTLSLVCFGWVLFNLSDTQTLMEVIGKMFSFCPTDWVGLLKQDTSVCSKLVFLPLAMVFSFPVAKKIRFPQDSAGFCLLSNVAYMAVLAFSIMYIISSSFTPFIYFSF